MKQTLTIIESKTSQFDTEVSNQDADSYQPVQTSYQPVQTCCSLEGKSEVDQ